MKKILTVSLFAIMAVSAANADIASTDYVGTQMNLAEKIANKVTIVDQNSVDEKYPSAKAVYTAIKTQVDALGDNVDANIEVQLGNVTDQIDEASGKIQTLENALKADGTTGKAIADNAAAISAMDAAYKEADTTTLNSAKAYADGLATNYDAAGSAAQALTGAKAYTDTLANGAVKDNTDAISAINNTSTGILAQAKSYADTKASEAEGSASKVAGDLADYISTNNTAVQKAQADATQALSDANTKSAQALTDAKAFTTAQIEALGKLATVDTACATGVTDCALVIRSGEIKWEKVSY